MVENCQGLSYPILNHCKPSGIQSLVSFFDSVSAVPDVFASNWVDNGEEEEKSSSAILLDTTPNKKHMIATKKNAIGLAERVEWEFRVWVVPESEEFDFVTMANNVCALDWYGFTPGGSSRWWLFQSDLVHAMINKDT